MTSATIKRTPLHVAIDGPVASGKSTVAKRLAARLGFAFLDTGALYRAVAYAALERSLSPNDESSVAAVLEHAVPEVIMERGDPLQYRIRINGKLLGSELFSPAVSGAVSPIAAMPSVRQKLIGAQRIFASGRNVVMAGRDITTVVLPDAGCKFFLTASLQARVERRLRELRRAGIIIDRESLYHEIQARDMRDTTRAVSPLFKAPDAVEIDTSQLGVDQVVDTLERLVRSRCT